MLFPIDQPPAVISLTSARTWPAGGVRDEDCKKLAEGGVYAKTYPKLARMIKHHRGEYTSNIRYDLATHDLFPTFGGDFRPAAETLDWLGYDFEGRGEIGHDCLEHADGKFSVIGLTLHSLASVLRIWPLQNTDIERTRAIGHLDPQRPVSGFFVENPSEPRLGSPRPFGTTHELEIEWPDGVKTPDLRERPHYNEIANPEKANCAGVTGWLLAARERRIKSTSKVEGAASVAGWDSSDPSEVSDPGEASSLTPIQYRSSTEMILGSQFRHGLMHSGMRPITHGNDPFWNVRALDTALSEHSGFVTFPLICTLNQLVMDDIVSKKTEDRRGSSER